MKNKKILSVFFSALMSLSLASCKGNESSSNSVASETSSSVESSSTIESSSSEESNVITIAEAIAIATEAGSTLTDKEYQITGIIETISNATYGEMTIKDDTGSLYIYGVFDKDRETRYDALSDKPIKGDEVTLLGKLKCFNGKPEMDRGYLQSFRHISVEENIDLSQYAESTIANARTVADGTKMKLTGVVTRITYANGYKPNGFYLVGDNSSIYVYGGDIASTVSEGNKISIACEKSYFILDSEISNANKHGYEGSCQVDNAYIITNDGKKNEVDLSWCQEKTVKEIIETPLTTNITTDIFKVNAIVNKEEGKGFVNYYFNDLDNKTGSYTYTMCNGGDFDWLDQFDGEICTVYLSPINCKSTNAGCVYRFIPIKVIDENYTFNVENAPEFAIEYFAKDQFKTSYAADPSLELGTSYSNEFLGFENVEITYTSSNSNVVYIAEENSKTILHTKDDGVAKITIDATYGSYTASTEVIINVMSVDIEGDVSTVKDAIDTADGEEVIVKGVVAASVVNKTGFYLIDESGVIAIETTADTLSLVELGNEVIISGTRNHRKNGTKPAIAGQSVIENATLIANLEGNHVYSTASFDTTKTVDEIYDLDETIDYSAKCYTVTAEVVLEESNYYSNIFIKDANGTKKLRLYCSSASQYGFLKAYVGQVVSLDVAPCNWNDKDYYTGCVLAVNLADGTKVLNNCNFK